MTKELLKFEITEALAKTQIESALSLSFANRGQNKIVDSHAKMAKKHLNYIIKLIREYNRKEQEQ